MKQTFTNESIRQLTVPTYDAIHHQRLLKQALLSAQGPHRKHTRLLKEGWSYYMTKKTIFAGAMLAISIIALGIIITPRNSPTAYAQETAQKSVQAIASLSSAKQTALKQQIGIDNIQSLVQQLHDAQNAKDATVLTYDQYMQLTNQGPSLAMTPTMGTAQLKSLQYLKFTKNDGQTVVIGLSGDGVPAIIQVVSGP